MPVKVAPAKKGPPPPPPEAGRLVCFLLGEIMGLPVVPEMTKLYSRDMRDAKILLQTYTIDELRDCLRGMKAAKRPVNTVRAVLWENPRTGKPWIEQFAALKPPAVYSWEYHDWVRRFGKRAITFRSWDGIYAGWDGVYTFPDGRGGALTREELIEIVGLELAEEAEKLLVEDRLSRRLGRRQHDIYLKQWKARRDEEIRQRGTF